MDAMNWSLVERELAGCDDDRTRCEECGEVIRDGEDTHGCAQGGIVWHARCAEPCRDCAERSVA